MTPVNNGPLSVGHEVVWMPLHGFDHNSCIIGRHIAHANGNVVLLKLTHANSIEDFILRVILPDACPNFFGLMSFLSRVLLLCLPLTSE